MFRFVILIVSLAGAYGDECCIDECRPTCAVPNPPDCPCKEYDPDDPCQCPPGFVLSEAGGDCIQIELCPDNLGCNCDENAIIKSCASPDQGTCDRPNTSIKKCKKKCKMGCECKNGYIRKEENGPCIKPEDCPCGYPCKRPNEVYKSCIVSCTPVYCPVNDDKKNTVCDIPSPCDSGCVCDNNYRRKSIKNDTCIPAECCPPHKCKGQNEIFIGCRPFCPRESCKEVGKSCSPPIVRQCDPGCYCKKDYFRDAKGRCVPKCECNGGGPYYGGGSSSAAAAAASSGSGHAVAVATATAG